MVTVFLLILSFVPLFFAGRKRSIPAILLLCPMLMTFAELLQTDNSIPAFFRYYTSDFLSVPAGCAFFMVFVRLLGFRNFTVRHIRPVVGIIFLVFTTGEFHSGYIDMADIFTYAVASLFTWSLLMGIPENKSVLQLI